MNTNILNKYDIEFRVISDSDGDKTLDVSQKAPTDLNYLISSYFLAMSPEIFLEDILPEINKALNGQPFNKEGGGFMTFLTIGTSISSFKKLECHSRDSNNPNTGCSRYYSGLVRLDHRQQFGKVSWVLKEF